VPASDQVKNQANKALVRSLWADLAHASADPVADTAAAFRTAMDDDVCWFGHAPVGDLVGIDAVEAEFWAPLIAAFPDLDRETHIFMGGQSNGRVDGELDKDGRWWVSGTGLFHATFAADYLGIPASGQSVSIRWGEFCCIDDGQITEVYFLLDVVDLMQQAGFDVLPPAQGADGTYPPPAAGDGELDDAQPADVTAFSLDHIRRFIYDGLNAYDENALESMGMADWFAPEVKWYGPGGIGACLSFTEFEDLHQAPWLVAFPDRQVQDLTAIFAEGVYTAAPGWAGVLATHTGPYLDQPATGNRIEFNGLDWWKRDGDEFVENWVFVDMVHLFAQFGVDLFDRLPKG